MLSFDPRQVTESELDHILDEIHNEDTMRKLVANNEVDWNEIIKHMQNGEINYVKGLISSFTIDVNARNPESGCTLLMYAIIIGNYDLVAAICNFGADVSIADYDGDDPLQYAIKYGRYQITELIFYRSQSGRFGADMMDIATQIHAKKLEAAGIQKYPLNFTFYGKKQRLDDVLIGFMMHAIKHKKPFSKDLFFYAWYFQTNRDGNPLHSGLWKVMMTTFESILCDTSDKRGWEWLKNFFVNSLIWYLPHPHPPSSKSKSKKSSRPRRATRAAYTDTNGARNMMDAILNKTLFWELLTRIRAESKRQSNILLKEKIDAIQAQHSDAWQALVSFDVPSEHSSNARQDTCGCLLPSHSKDDLSEDRYPPTTSFSAQKFYDTYIYLNELMFKANIMNIGFQTGMKDIAAEIAKHHNLHVAYRAGPVKTLQRAQAKVENDYINEDYPTSARILDINRCALEFSSITDLLKFADVFVQKVEDSQTQYHSIDSVIRCKNGWSVYDPLHPQYTDIKFNVKVWQKEHGFIIAEVQLLLLLMSAFKKKAHKLYSVERKFEEVYNYGMLQKEMSTFNNNDSMNQVIISITKDDDEDKRLKYFKYLRQLNQTGANLLFDRDRVDVNPCNTSMFHIFFGTDTTIQQYLLGTPDMRRYVFDSIHEYIVKYGETHSCYRDTFILQLLKRDKMGLIIRKFVQLLFDLCSAYEMNHPLIELLLCKDQSKRTFLSALFEIDSISDVYKFIIQHPSITDRNKIRLFGFKSNVFYHAMENRSIRKSTVAILRYLQNDAKQILRLLLRNNQNATESVIFQMVKVSNNDYQNGDEFNMILRHKVLSYADKKHIFMLTNEEGRTSFQELLFEDATQNRKALLILQFFKKDTSMVYGLIDNECAPNNSSHALLPVTPSPRPGQSPRPAQNGGTKIMTFKSMAASLNEKPSTYRRSAAYSPAGLLSKFFGAEQIEDAQIGFMRVLLHETGIAYEDKWEWLTTFPSPSIPSAFEAVVTPKGTAEAQQRRLKIAFLILQYFRHDGNNLLDLFLNEKPENNGGTRKLNPTLLCMLYRSTHKLANDILRYIFLKLKNISNQDKISMFMEMEQEEHQNNLLPSPNAANIGLMISYLVVNHTEFDLRKLIDPTLIHEHVTDDSLLQLLNVHDKEWFMQELMTSALVDQIITFEEGKCLDFLLSTDELTDGEKILIFRRISLEEPALPIITLENSLKILKFFQNDRIPLLRILSQQLSFQCTSTTFFSYLCSDAALVGAVEFVVKGCKVLSWHDRFRLFTDYAHKPRYGRILYHCAFWNAWITFNNDQKKWLLSLCDETQILSLMEHIDLDFSDFANRSDLKLHILTVFKLIKNDQLARTVLAEFINRPEVEHISSVEQQQHSNRALIQRDLLAVREYYDFVEKLQDTIVTDIVWDDFDANPFTTACKLGNIMIINKVMKETKSEPHKLEAILLKNQALKVLLQYKRYDMMVSIVGFLNIRGLKNISCKLFLYKNDTKNDVLYRLCNNQMHADLLRKLLALFEDPNDVRQLLSVRAVNISYFGYSNQNKWLNSIFSPYLRYSVAATPDFRSQAFLPSAPSFRLKL